MYPGPWNEPRPWTPEHVLGDVSAAFLRSLNFSLSFSYFGKIIPICNSLETKFEQNLHGGFKLCTRIMAVIPQFLLKSANYLHKHGSLYVKWAFEQCSCKIKLTAFVLLWCCYKKKYPSIQISTLLHSFRE